MFFTYAQQVNEKYVDEYLTWFHITQQDMDEYCQENYITEQWFYENNTWDTTEQLYLWAESRNKIIRDKLVSRKIYAADMIIEQFEKIAEIYEDNGRDVSVCDNCVRTYPQDWIIKNICPFCLKKHTNDLEGIYNEAVQ